MGVVVARDRPEGVVDPIVRRSEFVGNRSQAPRHQCRQIRRWIWVVFFPHDHRNAARLTLGHPTDIIFKPPSRHPNGFAQFTVRGGHRTNCRSGAPDEAGGGVGRNDEGARCRALSRVPTGIASSGISRRSQPALRRRRHRRRPGRFPSGAARPRPPGSRHRRLGWPRRPGPRSTPRHRPARGYR